MDCKIASAKTNGMYECSRGDGHEGPCAARPTLAALEDLQYKMLQIKQVLAAVIDKYGTHTDSGSYITITEENLMDVFFGPNVGIHVDPVTKILTLARKKNVNSPSNTVPANQPNPDNGNAA
jgi:hypothetical protein